MCIYMCVRGVREREREQFGVIAELKKKRYTTSYYLTEEYRGKRRVTIRVV